MEALEQPRERSTALRVIRGLGAVTLLGAIATFLFREWGALGAFPSYAQLIATTLALGLLGLALRKEAKGARTFLGLALASIPVNFAALGGVAYGAVTGASDAVPHALLAVVVGVALMVPVAALALLALARSHALRLGAMLAGSCALLLVPVRDLSVMGALLTVGTLALTLHERQLRWVASIRTWEARFVRATIFAPLVILAGRTALYYDVSAGFFVTACACAAWAVWMVARHFEAEVRSVLEAFATVPALTACVVLPFAVGDTFGWMCLVTALSAAVVLSLMGVFARAGRGIFLAAAAFGASTGAVFTLFFEQGSHHAAAATFAVGALGAVLGYGQRHGLAFILGIGTALVGLLVELVRVVDFGLLDEWITFAVLGAAVIALASVIERHGARMARAAVGLHRRFAAVE